MVGSKDLQVILVNDLCDGDITTANHRCSACFPYDVNEVSGIFIKSVQYAKSKRMGVIVGCDVNTHLICSKNTNARGLSY